MRMRRTGEAWGSERIFEAERVPRRHEASAPFAALASLPPFPRAQALLAPDEELNQKAGFRGFFGGAAAGAGSIENEGSLATDPQLLRR